MTTVDELAQIIRQVDGNNSLGDGALAEAIISKLPHLAARQPVDVNESDYVDLPDIFESARQPVGEPVADAGRSAAYDAIDRFLRNNMDDEAYAAYVEHLEALWAAVPAQAVDLGRFRKLASWVVNCSGHGINDSQRRMGEELLALIDSQAVGNK